MFTLNTVGSPRGFATFYTGHVADGRQLLAGWGEDPEADGLHFFWFDAEGRFLTGESFGPPSGEGSSGEGDIKFWIRHFRARRAELGYRAGPIRVRHFACDRPF